MDLRLLAFLLSIDVVLICFIASNYDTIQQLKLRIYQLKIRVNDLEDKQHNDLK